MIPKRLSTGLLVLVLAGSCRPVGTPTPQKEPQPNPASLLSHPAATPARVDFDSQVRPVLETRCQPCHFAGGTMYERLPFDQPQTIRHLGDKLFGQIEDEREQSLLRSFLAQEP